MQMMPISFNKLSAYREIWILDTEFQISTNRQHVPVCLCAEELRSGRRVELFFDQERVDPFPVEDDILFIGYNAAAEWGTFLALGWSLPYCILDLWFEYLNEINGVWQNGHSLRALGTGLVDALIGYGLDALSYEEKETERDYIIAHGVVPPAGVSITTHQRRILDYCWTDVEGTKALFEAMVSDVDLDQAVFRGKFSVPVAWFQFNGLPVDVAKYRQIAEHRQDLQVAIAEQVEDTHRFGVYTIEGQPKERAVFKADRFDTLIERLGISQWPLTATGHYSTDDQTSFEPMARLYPELEPLRQTRKAINSLSRFDITVSEDGRNRFGVFPFGGVTARNQPKASECVLLRPKWLRSLMQPDPGMALIQTDVVAAEAALAAAFSGDPEALRIYQSGADQYLSQFSTAYTE